MSDDTPKPEEVKAATEQAEVPNSEDVPKPEDMSGLADAEPGDPVDLGFLDQAEEAGAQLAKLESELDEAKSQMLRMQAEVQNIQRHARNDVEKAHKFGTERFVKEMLPVVDSLEKAIEACAEGEDSPQQVVSLKDGVELTLSMLLSALKKFEVQVVDPMGEMFDPQVHEAMSVLPRDDVKPNSVVAVLQKGYQLSGRLVRPAMVIVAKAP